MKKKILLVLLLIFLLPMNAYANENKVSINCDKYLLENNEETTCMIKAENFNFVTTSISGNIKLSNNLKLIESTYDDSKWKILDNKFNVKDINLISENKAIEQNYTIATFKIKAINKNNDQGKINFENLSIGDDFYEGHDISVEEVTINLNYNEKNEEKKGNNNLIVIIICTIIVSSIILIKNKKEK